MVQKNIKSRFGSEGLDFQKVPYDIILMDINMPKMDGCECTKELRKRWKSDELPIYAVTAKTFKREEKEMFEESFNGIIRKPVIPGEVYNVLKRVSRGYCGRRRSYDNKEDNDIRKLEQEQLMKKMSNNDKNPVLQIVSIFEKVSKTTTALLAFYIIMFASQEVFERSFIVFCICAFLWLISSSSSSAASNINNTRKGQGCIKTFVVPFTFLCLSHVLLGPYCHSIRLYFLANIVSKAILYFKDSYYKPFTVLIIGFLFTAFFEFSNYYEFVTSSSSYPSSSFFEGIPLGPISSYSRFFKKLSLKSINIDLMRINALFDILYVSQILINMVKLVVHKKQGDKDMLGVIALLEDDLVLQDSFSAKISHDLRTPIFACIFLLRKLEGDFKQPFFYKLRLCLYDLKREVDNLVDYYRLKHNKFNVNYETIPLSELVTNCVNENIDIYKRTTGCDLFLNRRVGSLRKVLKKKSNNMKFRYNCKSELPLVVYGDKDRIELVINNLISNAVLHTKKGEIEISTSYIYSKEEEKEEEEEEEEKVTIDMMKKKNKNSKEGLIVVVKDTGVGMSEDMKKMIFDNSVEKILWAEMNSLGIGLVTQRETLSRMGGSLSVVSEEGKGTRMEAYFPMKLVKKKQKKKKHEEEEEEEIERRKSMKSSPVKNNKKKDMRRVVVFDNNNNESKYDKEEEEEEEETEGEDEDDEQQQQQQQKNNEESKEEEEEERNIEPTQQQQQRVPTLEVDFHRINPVKIVVVEDNVVCLRMMKYYLETALGYRGVLYAETGKKALDLVTKDMDLCFVDYFLPDYTAFDLISDIRKVKGNDYTKFCLCSGNLFDSSVVEKEDILRLLYKPVRLESIKLALSEFYEKFKNE